MSDGMETNACLIDVPELTTDRDPRSRPLRWTEFPDRRSRSKTDRVSSLRQIARRISRTTRETKQDLPLLKLAEFGDQPTAKGSLRSNANMLAINGIELDYDDGSLAWDHAWGRLYEAGLLALLYTTPGHSEECHRFRVLLPTSRALDPAERARLVSRACKVLGGTVDPASFTLSQSYYFGSVNGVPVSLELTEPEGARCIDLADDLDSISIESTRSTPAGHSEPNDHDHDDDEFGDLCAEPDAALIEAALGKIPSEDRETWLKVGMALHDEFGGGEDGFDLWSDWSQTTTADNYEPSTQRSAWESFGQNRIGKPVTIASLYRFAKLQREPANHGELTFYRPTDSATIPSPDYVVKGLIARGDVSCIFGPPGAGKSLIAPHLAYQVALGEPVFGMRTRPGTVFYVAAEDEAGLHQRVAAILRQQGDAPNFRLVGGLSDLFTEGSSDLSALLDAIEQQKPTLIIIDTLAIAFPGLEENDSLSMRRVISVSRQLAAQGAGVLLVHHGTKADGSTPRGHSSLNGALDMTMRIERAENGIVRARIGKNKRGTSDLDIAFRIVTEELGTDLDGDPITAPIIHVLPASSWRDRVRLTDSESAAITKLRDLEGHGRVSEEAWRSACLAERIISGSEALESRKRAMRRAVQGLAKKGLIETRDEFVSSVIEATSDLRD